MITATEAAELYEYVDGVLCWKNTNYPAGSKRKDGYICNVKIQGKNYLAHRLIFLLHYGYLPNVVDHIDGNPSNNRIENLRESSMQTNQYNRKINKNNTSGIKNVYFCKKAQKWRVELKVNKQKKSFGRYEDLELAEFVAHEARQKYHKEFSRSK